jgi:mannose-6-phosphate isomerase
LRQFERLSGRKVENFTSALYQFANAHGWDDHGFIVDELDASGSVVAASRRAWPHTEGLKACVAQGEVDGPGCDQRAAQCLTQLQKAFLTRPIPAGWMDRISSDGAPLSDFIPASTFYHVFGAITEATRAISTTGHS